MSSWSNIEVSPEDQEIKLIDQLEKSLEDIPSGILKIRKLITGFEVCHFKIQQHLVYIKESVNKLEASIDPENIGANHIRKGENAWKKDKTQRSLSGQKYVWVLKKWLGDDTETGDPDDDHKTDRKISLWLGEKNPEKERLVSLLIARLLWDWNSYEKYGSGDESNELEFQVCRMDICHYNFPEILDRVLQGIGRLKPVKPFEGCGSYNSDIRTIVEQEFTELNELLMSITPDIQPERQDLLKIWLIACLAKTIKEQVGLTQPMEGLVFSGKT